MENFGNIKDTFNNLIIESVITKDKRGKQLFSKYIKLIKEDKNLNDQYFIYKNLQNTKFNDEQEAKDFIKENVELLKSIDTKSNTSLLNLLKGKKIYKENNELYEHINFLVNTKKSPSNLSKINESINFIKNRMMISEDSEGTTSFEMVSLPPSILSNLAKNKLNSRLSELNETEQEIVTTILNGSEDNKVELFKKLKKECITMIDSKLSESIDLGLKDKLLKVKDKLLNMDYDVSTFESDINRVYNLKESVSSN